MKELIPVPRAHISLPALMPSRKAGHPALLAMLSSVLNSEQAILVNIAIIVLNQAVRRNAERFPNDFMFRLTKGEQESLRSQSVISNEGRGGRRYLPYTFTEQGVAMLSSVLSSKRAIEVNIAIIRSFVRLRQVLVTQRELAQQLEELRWRQEEQGQQIQAVFETIQQLIEAPSGDPKKRFGFPTSKIGRVVLE